MSWFKRAIRRIRRWFSYRKPKPPKVDPEARRPPWYALAEKEIGVKEESQGHNPRILEYHSVVNPNFNEDEIPWCASFVCWCLEQTGFTHTNSALAQSFRDYGNPCEPKLGAIVVLKRGNKSWQGHVGFLVAKDGYDIWVLGGNQNNEVRVSCYDSADLLAIRWPW